jgi:hypothetical protein
MASKGLNVRGALMVARESRSGFFPHPEANQSRAGKTRSRQRKVFMRFQNGDSGFL